MKYCIGPGVIGEWPYLTISAQDFDRIRKARNGILTLVDIEEKFWMMAANYVEYEGDLLTVGLKFMAMHEVSTSTLHEARILVNRRLANLLTTARLYVDQVKHDITSNYGRTANITKRIDELIDTERRESLAFSIMEKVRDAMQHHSLLINKLDLKRSWEDRPTGSILCHGVVSELDLSRLLKDRRADRDLVAKAQKEFGVYPPCDRLLREYIQGLSRFHNEIRRSTAEDFARWQRVIIAFVQQYYEFAASAMKKNAEAYRVTDDDDEHERITLSIELTEYLSELLRRIPPYALTHCFVSNEHSATPKQVRQA